MCSGDTLESVSGSVALQSKGNEDGYCASKCLEGFVHAFTIQFLQTRRGHELLLSLTTGGKWSGERWPPKKIHFRGHIGP